MTLLFAFCALALAAQDEGVRVDFKGSKPTISDFVWTYLSKAALDDEGVIDEATNSVKQAWIRYRKGLPLEEGETITVDTKNGYAVYESRNDGILFKVEMCFWNDSDRKHKLFAINYQSFSNGKPAGGQFDGLRFWRYDNTTRTMTWLDDGGFEVEYYNTSYALPRTGKDIIVTRWSDDGTKKQETLKWNGHDFAPVKK